MAVVKAIRPRLPIQCYRALLLPKPQYFATSAVSAAAHSAEKSTLVMFQVQQPSNTPSLAMDMSVIDVYIIGGVGGWCCLLEIA